jgi:transcriptional regulator with XRE-family HTH domain
MKSEMDYETNISADQALKRLVADNITMYRKANGLTQIQLAEKLNYSDKAVSKWERGESLPDLYILMQIVDMFGITLNDLVTKQEQPKKVSKSKLNHTIVTLLSVGLVWLIAFIVYVILHMASVSMDYMVFLYSLPVAFIVLIVFSKIAKNRLWVYIAVTGLIFSIPLAICVQLKWQYNSAYLFLISGVLEVLTILWFMRKLNFKRVRE